VRSEFRCCKCGRNHFEIGSLRLENLQPSKIGSAESISWNLRHQEGSSDRL
jgi:predicted nucleic-acid-binding Zn-ribbon protein